MRTVSPIKARPLRQAGESVRDSLLSLVLDKLFSLLFMSGALWVLAVTEWFKYWRHANPSPVLYTTFAVAFSVYGLIRGYFLYRKVERLKLGLRGEETVGEYFNRLVAKGYRVFHDIPGEKGNIDHVIISTRGAFTVETKTRSKPAKGDAIVTFDGETLSFNNARSDDAAIRQAKAQAGQLKRILKEETGNDYSVQPVVVVPGWFVEGLPGSSGSDVWVLNPKSLHKWIDHEPEKISTDRVRLAATKLGQYIRRS